MCVNTVMLKMIAFSEGNLHDINHFLKVYAYAKTISEAEGLDAKTQETLELAAIVHDIACPLCRGKYGNTNGKYQELEGMPLTEELLKDMDIPDDMRSRVVWLVGHHHTLTDVDGIDHRILLEADYLVNADESGHTEEQIRTAEKTIFRTETGLSLLNSIYLRRKR